MIPTMQTRSRRLAIHHATRYSYDQPIRRSLHYIHLCPRTSPTQIVRSFSLSTEPKVEWTPYDDIFGNPTARFEVASPYRELSIVADSTVDLLDVDPYAFEAPAARPVFPLAWPLWEHQPLLPYLATDFPLTGSDEIHDYARSFAVRNRQDVLETAFDINLTLFRDFKYRPGTTTVETPAAEVLRTRQGVCQDFANLFISMARRLQIPARYVCGYVLSGGAFGDASHAWVQLYLPGVGWKDFDPTNGTLPTADHVVVAWGANYRDTAPIWGTLYSQAKETMKVEVRVADLGYQPGPAGSVGG